MLAVAAPANKQTMRDLTGAVHARRAASGFPGPQAVPAPLLVSATYGDLCRSWYDPARKVGPDEVRK